MADGNPYRLTLLENAYDSLIESMVKVEAAASEPRNWKFAVLHLVHALELILKERLHREHRLFLYENVDKRSRTVSLEGALVRLSAIDISVSEKEVSAIRTAIKWRNEITHHNVDLQIEHVRQNYLLIFEFLSEFHLAHIGEPLTNHFEGEKLTIAASLIASFNEEFVDFRGRTMHRSWPTKLLAAQTVSELEIDGRKVTRIAWGSETFWSDPAGGGVEPAELCRDCGCRLGELHGPGCCIEECAACHGQFTYCECEYGPSPFWELLD